MRRMSAAVLGIYGNAKQEAIYPAYFVDSGKQKLDGANHYALRFAPGQLPPVNAFWLLTLYELPSSLLFANPLNRYLINSPMLPGLERDANGGITLYVQNESPGKDRESNWLPSPKGPFFVIMRLYWPKPEAIATEIINQDHYVPVVIYTAGPHTFTESSVGTRYMFAAIRTLVDPTDPKDIERVHALQDAIKVSQKGRGSLQLPNWDAPSQKKIRDALLVLASTMPDFKGAFGTKAQVDPIRHLIGTAAAWGGNPDKDATYLNITPAKNDGTTIYKLNVKDVPVDAFWSVSLYNADGYYEKNPYSAYTINNLTAQKDAGGIISIQFGGCDGKTPNCLPITKGWNYTVRLYRPRPAILNGKWKFPEPQPQN